MNIGRKLIQLRKEKAWTQAYAAKVIEIQQSYLSKLENGRHLPSSEVLDKLSNAYDIPRKDLGYTPVSENKKIVVISILLAASMSLVLIGYFALLYPQTYYTYKISPIEPLPKQSLNINIHLTDKYLGERFIKKISSNGYVYELIAEKEVFRKENRLLVAIGLLMSLVTAGFLIATLMTAGLR